MLLRLGALLALALASAATLTPPRRLRYGIVGECTLADLPANYTGVGYQGLYDGPILAGGTFSEIFMLQAAPQPRSLRPAQSPRAS